MWLSREDSGKEAAWLPSLPVSISISKYGPSKDPEADTLSSGAQELTDVHRLIHQKTSALQSKYKHLTLE